MRIEVHARPAEEAEFTKDGVTRKYYKQWAIVELEAGLPNSFEFSTDEPLPPGPATLSTKSFNVVNGRLQMTRAVVVSLAQAPKNNAPKAA